MINVLFCSKNGLSYVGSDSALVIDGRYNFYNIKNHVAKVRESYKKNFPHKYKQFAYFKIVPDFRKEYNTKIYEL